jgi:hypothetical protein
LPNKRKISSINKGDVNMPNITETKITSSEVGVLWMSYMMKSLLKIMVGFFAQKTMEQKAKDILANYVANTQLHIDEIRQIFEKEKAVLPQAFSSKDVFADAPSLFDDMFHIMFLRTLAKAMLAFNSLHEAMSYRQDVRDYFAKAWAFAKDIYNECTIYLTEQGVLARPPYVTMPKEVEFIEEKRYMSSLQMLRSKRSLNTLEIAYIYQIIEWNIFGIQLMTGFAQVAKEREVREYFFRGKEISKKIVSELSSLMLDSDIHAPATWAGKATDSTVPPFSDKMMMYLSNIIASSAITGTSMGMAFSMRSDLPRKLAMVALDSERYAKDGGQLMISYGWLEEPPQMEDRNELIKKK